MLIGVTVLVLSITFASLFTLITMLFQNKAIIAVSCILLSFGLLLAGAICNRMLDAPPTIPAYSIGENGETTAQETENPKYSDGTKREIVQFFYDVNPGGQAIQCSTMQPVNLTRLPIYSFQFKPYLLTNTIALNSVLYKKQVKMVMLCTYPS